MAEDANLKTAFFQSLEKGDVFFPIVGKRGGRFSNRWKMRLGALAAVLVFCGAGCSPVMEEESGAAGERPAPQRIISLSPSVTETLFALGVGDRVVGVSMFCDYPPEVEPLPKVGDFFNPNLEAIVRLHPDLVVMMDSSQDFYDRLKLLKIPALMVRQVSVEDVLRSFGEIGVACGVEEAAESLTAEVSQALDEAGAHGRSDEQRPGVLIAVGHEPGPDGYQNVFIAGRDGFYDRLVWAAGGKNVYEGTVCYPQLSREGILRLNPEIIVDIAPDLAKRGMTREEVVELWGKTGRIRAVENRKIIVLDQDYASVPGPRMPLLLRDLKGVLQAP